VREITLFVTTMCLGLCFVRDWRKQTVTWQWRRYDVLLAGWATCDTATYCWNDHPHRTQTDRQTQSAVTLVDRMQHWRQYMEYRWCAAGIAHAFSWRRDMHIEFIRSPSPCHSIAMLDSPLSRQRHRTTHRYWRRRVRRTDRRTDETKRFLHHVINDVT